MEERIDLMKMNDSYSLNNLETGLSSTLKRGFDIVFSIVGLVPATPIVLVTTLAIVVESPGNPFYLQNRLGL